MFDSGVEEEKRHARLDPREHGENGGGEPQLVENAPATYVAITEDAVAEDDLYAEACDDILPEGAQRTPFTIIRRGNGTVTLRSNVVVHVSANAAIFGNNPVDVDIPAGATFTGRDRNNNGIPDVLEDVVRRKIVSWNMSF